MKHFLFLFIVAVAAGWCGADLIRDGRELGGKELYSSPSRISLLGGETGRTAEMPETIPTDGVTNVRKMLAQINSASLASLKQWLIHLEDSSQPQDELIQMVIARLALLDPEGAYHFLKPRDQFASSMTMVFIEWSRSDLDQALEVAFTPPYDVNFLSLMKALDADKRESIYQRLLEFEPTHNNAWFFKDVFPILLQDDPEGAADRALEYSIEQMNSMWDLMNTWYQLDPEAAYQWSISKEEPKARKIALDSLARSAARYGEPDALDRLWPHLDEGQRMNVFNNLRFSIAEIDSLFEWMDENVKDSKTYESITKGLLGRHGRSPTDLPDIVSRLTGSIDSQVEGDIRSFAESWAAQDQNGVEAWLETIEDKSIRNAVMNGVLARRARIDPLQTIRDIEANADEYFDPDERDFGLIDYYLAEELPNVTHHENIPALLDRLPEKLREQTSLAYASSIAFDAPEATFDYIRDLPSRDDKKQVMRKAMRALISQDPLKAAERVDALNEGSEKERAAFDLINGWARFDPHAARTWLEDQSPSASRDTAAAQMLHYEAFHHPTEAIALAMSIDDPSDRDRSVLRIITDLAHRDPSLASEQLDSVDLPANELSQIHQLIEQERALREHFTESLSP